MKATLQLILLLAMTSLVSAIRVPIRLPDGVYELSTRKVSTGTRPYFIARYDMELYSSVNLTAKDDDNRGPLVSTRHRCAKPTATHDSRNLTAARAMLNNWCALYKPRVQSIVAAVLGNEVWYMCTYRRKNRSPALPEIPQSCAREEIDMVSNRLDRWCGVDKIAAVDIDDWTLTYGRTQRNASFCRRQKFRGTWAQRLHSGIHSGPGPEEDGPVENDG
ncbi:hypothetical protein ACQKWADRAFT_328383 [Trichoderma austrokoningii]